MAVYELGVSKAAAATATAYATIIPATSDAVSIREIGVFNSTAVSSSIGLLRTLTTGTASTSAVPQALHPSNPAGVATIVTAWSVAPTIAGSPVYLRKIVLPATAGAGVIWQWAPNELVALNGATTSLVLWNFAGATSAAVELYIRLEE